MKIGVGQVKVKGSRIPGGSRPRDSDRALSMNLGSRLVELQGRDGGNEEK